MTPSSATLAAGMAAGLAMAAPGGARLEAVPRPETVTETPLYPLSLPPEGPGTEAQAALGAKLFYDVRLSSDGTVDCDGCHLTYQGFADFGPSFGVHRQKIRRNAPTLFNAMFNDRQFWDGRAATLEEQARGPLLSPFEMGNGTPDEVARRLGAIPEYRDAFRNVFGGPPTLDSAVRAIASFERRQIGLDAPFDRFAAGDDDALGAAAKRGWALFNGRGRCLGCHPYSPANPFFTDRRYHDIGVGSRDLAALAKHARAAPAPGALDALALRGEASELGRYLVTGSPADIGAFKTPTLRNVAVTAPYMHDGSFATLWDVVDHYDKGGNPGLFQDGAIQRLGLSDPEIDDLVAFLESLTSDRYAARARLLMARQRARAAASRPQRDRAAARGARGDRADPLPPPGGRDVATLGAF